MESSAAKIQARCPTDSFSDQELKLLFPEWTAAARYNRVKRALANKELIRVTRGLYCLSKNYQRQGLNLFSIANRIESPSYISLESALRYYQLIPESVMTTSLVTPHRSRELNTPLGHFSFTHLPLPIFQRDFIRQKEGSHAFFIATPMKALLDLIYLQHKDYQSLDELQEDLRLNLDQLRAELKPHPNKALLSYKHLYRRPRVSKVVDLILWELL